MTATTERPTVELRGIEPLFGRFTGAHLPTSFHAMKAETLMLQQNQDLVTAHIRWLRTVGKRSEMTCTKYSYSLQNFVEWCGDRPFADLSTEDLEHYVCDRPRIKVRQGQTLSPTTIKREFAELRGLYKFLVRAEVTTKNPSLNLISPSPHEAEPSPCRDEDWRAIWFSDLPDDSERVAMGLGYFCGLRRHEITLLRPDQVEAGILLGVKRKGGNKSSVKYVSNARFFEKRRPDLTGNVEERFLESLHRLLRARQTCTWLLPWRDQRGRVAYQRSVDNGEINPANFNKRLVKLCVAAGLGPNDVRPHALRHSFCTNLIRLGVDLPTVSRLAGHAKVDITMRYIRTSDDPLGELL